jgi:hypothetical protein
MTIGRKLVTLSAVPLGALIICTSRPETAAPTLPSLTTLVPGGDLAIQQSVDVNVVLIGWEGLVDLDRRRRTRPAPSAASRRPTTARRRVSISPGADPPRIASPSLG